MKDRPHVAIARTLKIHDFLKNNEGQAFKIREIGMAVNANPDPSNRVTHNALQLVRESIYRMLNDDRFQCIKRERIGRLYYIYHDGSNCTL